MKKINVFAATTLLALGVGIASAQIRINIPNIAKPKATPTPTPAPVPGLPNVTNTKAGAATPPQAQATSGPPAQPTNGPKWMVPPAWNDQLAIIRETIDVKLDTTETYWKAPGQFNYTSWYPNLSFKVAYKSTLAPRLEVEWFNPDGSPWFTDQIGLNFQNLYDTKRNDEKFKKATNMGGTYGFKITDTRNGSVLFEGKFKVTKFPDSNGNPMFKNTFGFAIDHDGELPYGFVYLNWAEDRIAPQLNAALWIKGDNMADAVEARLFYNGQEISTTDSKGGSASSSMQRRPGKAWEKYPDGFYKLWEFAWNVRYRYQQSNMTGYPTSKFINEADGTYTIKVFLKGVQIREASFEVKNGIIEGTGLAEANGYTAERVVIPVKLMPSTEKWTPAGIKDGFFGNPFRPAGAAPMVSSTMTVPPGGGANSKTDAGSSSFVPPPIVEGVGPWMKPVTATNKMLFEMETLEIRCDTKERYWKFPDQSYYSSWVPAMKFRITYNNETTPRLVAEYFTPDGKSWFTEPLDYSSNEAKTPYSNDERFKNGSVAAGVYGVKITDTRTNAVLFEGKFRVVKFKWGESTPMYKNQFGFAADFDGALQVGQVRLDYKRQNDAPHVVVGMWLKEPKNLYRSDLEARMYLNGQQIATTDDRGQSEQVETRSPNASNYYPDGRYEFWEFRWPVRYFAFKSVASYPNDHFINKSDGEYTVKLFYKGELLRETGFTVKGGIIADNGFASSNGFSGLRAIVPVKVIGTRDKWNPANAKTDGFWGRPVKGIH